MYKVCDVCGKTNACETDCVSLKTALEEARKGDDQAAITDAENALKTHLETSHKDDVTIKPADQLTHTKPEETEPDPDQSKPATCEEDGKTSTTIPVPPAARISRVKKRFLPNLGMI